jgi:UDP-2,3-diacylglucosamine pyrophosphatase LpxH
MNRPVRKFRTVWISDLHLGTKACNAELLLNFYRHMECEKLYLVGDIVDGWKIKRGWFWTQAFSDVIQKTLRLARKGTQVIYIPGNHDEFLRDYTEMNFGNILIKERDIHETADGRRLLIMHGDEFDSVMRYAPWLAYIGDKAYELSLRANIIFNRFRAALGFPYWSLSAHLKHKVKKAIETMSDFRNFLVDIAVKHQADGIICGHIHHAEIVDLGKVTYYNTGDWVESCTALVEYHDGKMEILYWAQEVEKNKSLGLIEAPKASIRSLR